jgi:hypothetical protein
MSWTELMQQRTFRQATMNRYWNDYVNYIGQCYKLEVQPMGFWKWFQNTRPDSSWITKAS